MSQMDFDKVPWWPTQTERRYGDLLVGVDNTKWLYRAVPLGPVDDAVSIDRMLEVGQPLEECLVEIANLTGPTRSGRRRIDKNAYRKVHILLVNIPKLFVAPEGHPNQTYLQRLYGDQVTTYRSLVLGVELRAQTGGGGGLNAMAESVAHTMFEGGRLISDYDADRRAVDAAMSRCGLRSPSDNEIRVANSWWNRGSDPDVPYMPHGDHLHLFSTANAATSVARLNKENPDCSEWGNVPGEHTVSLSTVNSLRLPFIPASDRRSRWASSLISNGAVAISIRGLLEPPGITRNELRRRRKQYTDDIKERVAQNKMQRGEQEEMLAHLSQVEDYYATGEGAPSMVDMSITVALSGRDQKWGFDPREIGEAADLVLNPMNFRQEAALLDTMLCSGVRANPHLHDVPITMLAYSGLPNISTVGDSARGALLGFTEVDRQPAWLDHMAAVDEDSMPVGLVVGQTGSGKSVTMQWLADQYARIPNDKGEQTPVVMLDLKMGSDFSPAVELSGGETFSLDSIIASDGVFDPLRFASNPEAAADMAHSLIMQVNPFGNRKIDMEAPLRHAIGYGIDHGARCTGEAIEIAFRDEINPDIHEVRSKIKNLSSPMFRALCGFEPEGQGLRVSGGVTYIRIGDANLDLPEGIPVQEHTMAQRTALALVKAMVFGSIYATANRQGVVMFDEGWIFLSSGKAEMDRVGRLARSQQVFPIIFTQKARDAIHAGMEGYISRGIILPIQEEAEARAALELFKLEARPDRLARIMAKPTIGSAGDHEGAPNWSSMRALRDPRTGKVLRGVIGLYVDLTGNAVPVEVTLTPEFLQRSSTNREDMIRRAEAAAESKAVPVVTKEVFDEPAPVVEPVVDAPVPVVGDLDPYTEW